MGTTNYTYSNMAPYRYGWWQPDGTGNYLPINSAGFIFTFTGTQAALTSSGLNNTYTPYNVSVDGGAITNPAVSSGTLTLATGLSDTTHTVYMRMASGYGAHNAPWNLACVLSVTGASPAIGAVTGTGGQPVQSAIVGSGSFAQSGYFLTRNNYYPNYTGGLGSTVASSYVNFNYNPLPIDWMCGSAVRGLMTFCFNAQLQYLGLVGHANTFGPAVNANYSYAFCKVYKDDQFLFHGKLAPDDAGAASPIFWVSSINTGAKVQLDTSGTSHKWKLVIGGAYNTSSNVPVNGGYVTALAVDSTGSFGTAPPPRRPTLLCVGDSRTSAYNCTDTQCDATRGYGLYLADLMGYDGLLHAYSGTKVQDHDTGGSCDLIAQSAYATPATVDAVLVDLTTNSDFTTYGSSSNTTWRSKFLDFCNRILNSVCAKNGLLIIVAPNSGAYARIPTPADGTGALSYDLWQVCLSLNNPRVIFIDLSNAQNYGTCLGTGGHQSAMGQIYQANQVWQQLQYQLPRGGS